MPVLMATVSAEVRLHLLGDDHVPCSHLGLIFEAGGNRGRKNASSLRWRCLVKRVKNIPDVS